MKYPILIHKLFNVKQFGGIKFGLTNMHTLLEALNYPEKAFSMVHVAGTNGKGSVTTKIAAGLQCHYAKIGLFTSPHINTFRERIQINNVLISEEDTVHYLEKIFALQEKLGIFATFFELTTLLAFLYFAEKKVDYAVMETGLGGRLDATNVITPKLSIITSISYDHTEVLGNSLEEIASEKAGIIKENVPVIIGPNVPKSVIAPICQEKNAPLIHIQDSFATFNEENNAIARKAMEYLQLNSDAIHKGEHTLPPCRFEIIRDHPPVICDVAHNPDGFTALFNMLKRKFPKMAIHVVLGLSSSKDLPQCLDLFAKQTIDHFYLVKSTNGRGASTEEIQTILLSFGIPKSKISLFKEIKDGVRKALTEQNKNLLLITGSFFIMREAREELGIIEASDSLDLNELAPSRLIEG